MNNNLKHPTHDSSFKVMMANKKLATEFFNQHLPLPIKKLIDFESLELCKESYIDNELSLSAVDVLYKAHFNEKPGYLYIISEHQSRVDKLMPFRLLKYMIKIMDHHIKSYDIDRLPVIFPMVFYHGQHSWNSSMDLFDLFGDNKDLAKSILLQPYKLIDVNQIPDNELKNSSYAGVMSFIFKHIFARDILPYLEQIKDQLLTIENDPNNKDLLINLLKYIIIKGRIDKKEQLTEFINVTFSKEIGKKMATTAELYYQEGLEKGVQQGVQQGIEKGVQQGVEKGEFETKKRIASNLLNKGHTLEEIAEITGLTVEQTKNLH